MDDQQTLSGRGTTTGTSSGTVPVPGSRSVAFSESESRTTTTNAFDYEKLDVGRAAREFLVLVEPWLPRKLTRDMHDQLDRAARSILSNIAEGAGKTSRPDKRRLYEIARGSAMECAAQIDILQIRRIITAEEYARGRELLLRIVKMLSRMVSPPR